MAATAQVFRLPDLGEGLTDAEIVSWKVAVGDDVGVDQEVVVVETAKAAVGVPCPYAGTVAALHAEPGAVVEVGAPLITVNTGTSSVGPVGHSDGDAGSAGGEQYRTEERAGAEAPEDQPVRPLIGYGAREAPRRSRQRRGAGQVPTDGARAARSARAATATAAAAAAAAKPAHAVRVISPLVRKLAEDWSIDLREVRPGPTGVIRRADLESHREASTTRLRSVGGSMNGSVGGDAPAATVTAYGQENRIPITGLSRIMVERLTTSRQQIPDATTWVDADATRLLKTKDALRAAQPDAGIGVLALLGRITTAGLAAYPALNSSVDLAAGQIVQHGQVNLGFAAQSPRGLVVPVVHEASAMTTAELAATLRELTEKARQGQLSPAELTGGTFTLNNYGVFGVDGSTPIINYPEAAMLGVGRIVDKPWAHRGKVRLRKVTQLSFTFDHRVCDGGTAGGFLRFVADAVADPRVLLGGL